MAKRKTTIYVDEDLLRAAKVSAARAGKKEYEVFEAALRAYLGLDVLEAVWARSDLSEEQAMELANREIHQMRREQTQ